MVRRYSSSCFALSTSTGATGTSAASGGFAPVGTTRMRSTTSMPSHHAPEHAEAGQRRGGVAAPVQLAVVDGVDEELRGGRGAVGDAARGGERAAQVRQAVVGLVGDRRALGLLLHVRRVGSPWIRKSPITRWKMVPL
jgi:hypothetical protein